MVGLRSPGRSVVLLDLRSGPPASTCPERHQLVRFFEDVIERLRGAPGIESASAVANLPMQSAGVTFVLPFNVEGQPPPESEDPRADVRLVRLFNRLRESRSSSTISTLVGVA